MKLRRNRIIIICTILIVTISVSLFIFFNQLSIKKAKEELHPIVINSLNIGLSSKEISFVNKVQLSILPSFIVDDAKCIEYLQEGIEKYFSSKLRNINNYYDRISKLDYSKYGEKELEEITYSIFLETVFSQTDLELRLYSLLKQYDENFYNSIDKYYKGIEKYSKKSRKFEKIDSYQLSRMLTLPQFNSKIAFASFDTHSHYYSTIRYNISRLYLENFLKKLNNSLLDKMKDNNNKAETIAYQREVFRKNQESLSFALSDEMKFFNACIEQQGINNLKKMLRNN